MHDEHGPRRLRQGNDTPQSLLRAIDALRKGVDDSARLSRVGSKLESVLNAPPAAAELVAQAAKRSFFGEKAGTLKLILGGLGLFVAIAPLFLLRHADDGAVPAADRDGSSEARTSVAPPTQPQPQADEVAREIVDPQTVAAKTEPADMSPPPRRAAKHAAHARERNNSLHEARTENAPHNDGEAVLTPAKAEPPPPTLKATQPSEPSGAAKNPQPSAAKPKLAEDAPLVPAEADLLLKARKALKLDPNLTLSLVAEHRLYYPKGRLVPEREVLAIEALRNLGRKQEADERLKKFEARYPKSIHLQRLHEAQ